MTIKIMRSTRRISIYGVILISDMAPFLVPTFIDMVDPFLSHNGQGRTFRAFSGSAAIVELPAGRQSLMGIANSPARFVIRRLVL